MKVSLYVREHSTRKYRKAKSTEPAGTVFVLRYGGTWETLDAENWNDARVAQLRKQAALLEGWRPKVEKKKTVGLMLDAAIDQYLAEIKDGRKKKTYQAYDIALRYFFDCIGNKPIKEINRSDMLKFNSFLRDHKKQSARSCWNKFSNVMSFLKHHEVKPKVKPHDWPKFVEEEPEIYEQETLDKFFAACDKDELLLFEFFLMTGMREQEVIYATDRCVDFENHTISVRRNAKFEWTPKMYKERTIPVPKALTEKLKRMLMERGKGGLLFPTKSGLPKFNFLDMAKAIARRAGIPESEVWLHKFRATFCTRALWSGIDLRTVQDWMGHDDLSSTLRYLKPDRGNTLLRRYLQNTKWIKNSTSTQEMQKFNAYEGFFKKYAGEYNFDYLMVAAQGYQESQFDQNKRSRAGAVGIMQVIPKVAAENPIDIPNVTNADGNIHAGCKILRNITDTYFNDPGTNRLNKTLFTFASYDAGPNKIVQRKG